MRHFDLTKPLREPPTLLTVEYLEEFGLYIVVPCAGNKEGDYEYMFSDYLSCKSFIDSYYISPIAAIYAYEITESYNLI